MGCLLLGCLSTRAEDSVVVYFPYNRSLLSASDAARIDSIGRLHLPFMVAAYCDSIGSDRYNDSLAAARAAVGGGRLLTVGLADSLISVEIYGRRGPVNDNATESERAANRRVVIRWRLSAAVAVAVARPRDPAAI